MPDPLRRPVPASSSLAAETPVASAGIIDQHAVEHETAEPFCSSVRICALLKMMEHMEAQAQSYGSLVVGQGVLLKQLHLPGHPPGQAAGAQCQPRGRHFQAGEMQGDAVARAHRLTASGMSQLPRPMSRMRREHRHGVSQFLRTENAGLSGCRRNNNDRLHEPVAGRRPAPDHSPAVQKTPLPWRASQTPQSLPVAMVSSIPRTFSTPRAVPGRD